jgi:Holliday junction resolvase RusA-like endonuclease
MARYPYVADAMMVVDPAPAAAGAANNDPNYSLHMTVEGVPMVQERPRHAFNGNTVHVFDPSARAKKSFKKAIRRSLFDLGVHQGMLPLFKGQQSLEVTVEFWVKNDLKDVDNLFKFVLDALEKVVYHNDRFIRIIHAHKHHVAAAAKELTTIRIETVETV